jgi:quercetin dioxygenase-like cupin family protein
MATIIECSAQAPVAGSPDYFTGDVVIRSRFAAIAPGRADGAIVAFQPGARTAWHTHPLGQLLIVIEGEGLVQSEGGPVRPIRAGDVVWFAPNERHWHGASPVSPMTHIAMQEPVGGKAVDWLEHVSDDQYAGGA